MKILIVRFSSFGDVLQCLSVAGALARQFPKAEIHWVTRAEFAPLIETHPAVQKVWTMESGRGLGSLLRLAWDLRRAGYTHVYDAHNNLRSHVIGWILQLALPKPHFLRRSIYRFRRFLLFRFRINRFPQPFSGQRALLEPLAKWGVDTTAPSVPQLWISGRIRDQVLAKFPVLKKTFVALAPSAAFELKRWPVENWKKVIQDLPNVHFAILGGPKDDFLKEIMEAAPGRAVNLAGQLSLPESAAVIESSHALISNDTGLMHVAEQLGKPCIALMGPAPFGYPSRPLTSILETPLACRPCSKHGQGPCVNPSYQKCLRDITPGRVEGELRKFHLADLEMSGG